MIDEDEVISASAHLHKRNLHGFTPILTPSLPLPPRGGGCGWGGMLFSWLNQEVGYLLSPHEVLVVFPLPDYKHLVISDEDFRHPGP